MGECEQMDKVETLKKILKLDPNNNFARYGLAMELAGRGETDEALAEFDALLANDPNYLAGYAMSAQVLAKAGHTQEAIARLKAGVNCGTHSGNQHAVSQMQSILDELER
jgi:predicted Zn-dependent protease